MLIQEKNDSIFCYQFVVIAFQGTSVEVPSGVITTGLFLRARLGREREIWCNEYHDLIHDRARWKPQDNPEGLNYLWTRFNAPGLIGAMLRCYIYSSRPAASSFRGQLSESLVYADIWCPDIRTTFCRDRWCHHDWLIQRVLFPQSLWLADRNTIVLPKKINYFRESN